MSVEHKKQLREDYVNLSPRRRLKIIQLRISNPESDPNKLIIYVSAVEALARSLVINLLSSNKSEINDYYEIFKNAGPASLVATYLLSTTSQSPENVFTQEVWQTFNEAVSYRNLLVHECTYLGQNRTPDLIHSCELIFNKIAQLAGISENETAI